MTHYGNGLWDQADDAPETAMPSCFDSRLDDEATPLYKPRFNLYEEDEVAVPLSNCAFAALIASAPVFMHHL